MLILTSKPYRRGCENPIRRDSVISKITESTAPKATSSWFRS